MADRKELTSDVRRQFKFTDEQIKNFVLRLDAFLYRHLDFVLRPVTRRPEDQAEVVKVLGSLYSSLKQLGLDHELRSIERIYGSQLEHIRDSFGKLGVTQVFSDIDVSIVKNLIDFDTSAVANNIRLYTNDVAATMMRSVIAGEEPDFAAVHEKFGAPLARNIETETTTLLQSFSRSVTVGKARELGFTLMIYVGPDDKVTRPFCDSLLAKDPPIYAMEEIERMDNGQGLDVLSYGGGYNCRHDWRPISEESARELGWNP